MTSACHKTNPDTHFICFASFISGYLAHLIVLHLRPLFEDSLKTQNCFNLKHANRKRLRSKICFGVFINSSICPSEHFDVWMNVCIVM